MAAIWEDGRAFVPAPRSLWHGLIFKQMARLAPASKKDVEAGARLRQSGPSMSHQKSDGMNYAPEGKPNAVVEKGEFLFAAVALDHGHIYGQCKGLIEAGGSLRYVYDPDPVKVEKFCKTFPSAEPMPSVDSVLEKSDVVLVVSAAVPNERGPLGLRVMDAGKDYFTGQGARLTTEEQLKAAREKAKETGRSFTWSISANGSMSNAPCAPGN